MLASDAISLVRSAFSDPSKIQISDDEIVAYMNRAIKEIAYDANFNQTIAVADITKGKSEYNLPVDMLTLITIKYNGNSLQALSPQEADNFIASHDNSQVQAVQGTPTHYWVFANAVFLHPSPDQNITGGLRAYYTRTPNVVILTTDILDIPVQFESLLIDKIMQWAHEKDENWTAAQIKENQYTSSIKQKTEDESWDEHESYPNITASERDSDAGENLYTGLYWY